MTHDTQRDLKPWEGLSPTVGRGTSGMIREDPGSYSAGAGDRDPGRGRAGVSEGKQTKPLFQAPALRPQPPQTLASPERTGQDTWQSGGSPCSDAHPARPGTQPLPFSLALMEGCCPGRSHTQPGTLPQGKSCPWVPCSVLSECVHPSISRTTDIPREKLPSISHVNSENDPFDFGL